MKPAAATAWERESNVVFDEEVGYQDRFIDPVAGVRPLRLTTLPFGNAHIYPEAPVSTQDGRCFVFARHHPPCGFRTFWVADMATLSIRQVTDEPDATPPAFALDGSVLYYTGQSKVWRMVPGDFRREEVCDLPDDVVLKSTASTISSCGTRLACAASNGERVGALVVDLSTGHSALTISHPDAHNVHVQYCRGPGRLLLVQINHGIERDAAGNITRLAGDLGCALEVMQDDGTRVAVLPMGRSPLERVQGHQCWLGGEEKVISALHVRDSIEAPWHQHRIGVARVGAETYDVVCEGTHEAFTHIHTTRDGRYWVSDCNRTGRIYVGSTRTQRYKPFCDSGASFGAMQLSHPHPFFLADDAQIGWNSDVTGVNQVYVARIPDAFLDDLQ